MRNLIVLILLFCWGTASAAPIVWQLQDVVFDDGGIATGSFTYDADLKQISSISISTTDGLTPMLIDSIAGFDFYETFQGESYVSGFYNPLQAGRYNFYTQPTPDVESPYTLAFQFLNEIDDGASTYSILSGFGESSYGLERNIVSGEVTAISGYLAAVPIPAAAWLFGSAIVGLGWLRRSGVG